MESPSAMGQGFSNTPQPKPDRGSGPVPGHGKSLNRLTPSGMGGRLDQTPGPFPNQTANIFHPQHLMRRQKECVVASQPVS